MNLLQRLFRRRLAPGLLTLACAFPVSFSGQIQLDGLFEDWSGIPANWEAPAGTTGPYTGLALTQDAASLFLRLSLSAPVALDETILPNAHILLLDTDNNPATGNNYANQGLGVDLLIHFGARNVVRYTGNAGSSNLNSTGMLAAPTYSAQAFEILLDREACGLVAGNTLRALMYHSSTGTVFPAGGATLALTAPVAVAFAQPLERPSGTATRVAFWNVNGRMDQPTAQAAMGRILAAVQPDILGLSEVDNMGATTVRNLLNSWMPLPDGASWTVVKDDYDLMVASRYPIPAQFPGVTRQFPTLVTLPAPWPGPMCFVSSHLKCCGGAENEVIRQQQADELVAFLRDTWNENHPLWHPQSPRVYGGDLNMVGLANPILTLLTGDISDETVYGTDHAPDNDGTPWTECPALQSDAPVDFTWGNGTGSWIPGKLDYILTSDASAQVLHSFVLQTQNMSVPRLFQYQLQANDASVASDHLLVVADLAPPTGGEGTGDLDSDGDGVLDAVDNCQNIANASQTDFNTDGLGDACSDLDGDGLSDLLEIQFFLTDPGNIDTNGNGIPDPLECLSATEGSTCTGDLNIDGVVSISDLLTLLGLFGTPC